MKKYTKHTFVQYLIIIINELIKRKYQFKYEDNLIYCILIQVELNKEKNEFNTLYINYILRYYILKDGISNFTGRNIYLLSLLFFFEYGI